MSLRAFAVLIVAVSVPAAAKGAAEELRSQLERRLKIMEALRGSSPRFCDRLIEISQAVPPRAVISRLAFSGKTGRVELALSQGTTEDATAIVQRLVTKDLCTTPVSTLEGSVIAASCTVEDSRADVALAVPTLHSVKHGELEVLRQRQDEAQSMLPDVADLENYELFAKDVATRAMVKAWSLTIGPAVPERALALDRFEVSGSGSASFAAVAEVLCSLSESRRITTIDAFELKQPRVRNGEWVIDFAVAGSIWRYRRELEQKDVFGELKAFHEPKYDPTAKRVISMERSPFGPPAAVFAGSTRVLKGTECRKEGSVSTGELEGRELDDFSVAFVALKGPSACAMLVDAQGECHELRRNTKLGAGGGKVTGIDAAAVTVTHFEVSTADDGKPHAVRVGLKVPGKTAPPAWFCTQK